MLNPDQIPDWAILPSLAVIALVWLAIEWADARQRVDNLEVERDRIITERETTHDPRCIALTDSRFNSHCDCKTLKLLDARVVAGECLWCGSDEGLHVCSEPDLARRLTNYEPGDSE